ncbi:MAG TPA: DUF3108 domain-containing protein [Aquabacterium sp.]|nr:DUF3108 domain-containing protein [Aquabacterium sp.]
MAQGMNRSGICPYGWRCWLVLLGLTFLMLVLHLSAIDFIGHSLPETGEDGKPAIKRMEATYVKEVKLSKPPVGLARPAAPPPGSAQIGLAKKRKPHSVEPKASEPEEKPLPLAQAASSASAPAAATPASAPTQVAAASAPLAAASKPDKKAPVFEWPKATRVSYNLKGYFRGNVTGSGVVEWLKEGPKYQVHLDFRAGGLFSSESTSEGLITPEGLYPQRNEVVNSAPFTTMRHAIELGDEEITLFDGTKVPRPPAVQDMISNIVQLAYEYTLDPSKLAVGQSTTKRIALRDRLVTVRFNVQAEEEIMSPMGPLRTFHVKPVYSNEDNRPMIDTEVWFAPELQYLPVRIEVERSTGKKANQFKGTLEMERPPQQVGARD